MHVPAHLAVQPAAASDVTPAALTVGRVLVATEARRTLGQRLQQQWH